MSKHTPGPWTAVIEKDDGHVVDTYVVDADEDVVVTPSAKLSEADARLIAAAPEMREVLIDILGWISRNETVGMPTLLREKARAAIAKAEGGS